MKDEMNDLQYTTTEDPDIVKVVRCRDCKNFMKEEHPYREDIGFYCNYFKRRGFIPNSYCSYGEKRDGMDS